MPQRVLWASTGTKSPDLSKTLYVDSLVGDQTVNTVPSATLDCFRETGTASDALGANREETLSDARATLSLLDEVGISLKEITDELLPKGCQLFSDAFDALLTAVAHKREAVLGDRLNRLSLQLGNCSDSVQGEFDDWRSGGKVRRLHSHDPTLWSDDDEGKWLQTPGYLDFLDRLFHPAHGGQEFGVELMRRRIIRIELDRALECALGSRPIPFIQQRGIGLRGVRFGNRIIYIEGPGCGLFSF